MQRQAELRRTAELFQRKPKTLDFSDRIKYDDDGNMQPVNPADYTAVREAQIKRLKEMKAQGYDPKAMFMEKGGNTGNFVKITGGLGLGVMAANWFADGMGLAREKEFIDKYAAKIGGVNSDLGILVCGYSIAYVLADAIKAAGGVDPAKLSAAIGATNGDYAIGHIQFTEGHSAPLKEIGRAHV